MLTNESLFNKYGALLLLLLLLLLLQILNVSITD